MSKSEMGHGARWVRAALQVNPYSYNGKVSPKVLFETEDQYNKALIDECKKLQIEIIAITDHWCVSSAATLIEQARSCGITALPGFEANSSDGVHILVIFPEHTPFDNINAAIALAGGDPGQESGPGTKTTNAIIDEMTARGALAIPAHANAENTGLFKLKGQPLEKVIDNKNLTGIAVSLLDDNKFEEKEKKIFRRESPFNRTHKLAKIYADDISSPHQLNKASGTTWLKITEPSLEAIKTALKSPDTRIRLQEPQSLQIKSIDSISWDKGFFEGVTVPFNQELTTIIGGRGTGKSTIIESIRYALNITPLTPQISEEHNSLIDAVIEPGTTITLKVTGGLASSKQYTVQRTVGQRLSEVYDTDGRATQFEPNEIISGISIFSQHELSELSRHGDKLADMVLQLRGEDTSRFDLGQTIPELERNLRQLESTVHELDKIDDRLSARDRLTEIITEYETSNHAKSIREQNKLRAHKERIQTTHDSLQEILGTHSSDANNTITTIKNRFLTEFAVDKCDDTSLDALIHSQIKCINDYATRLSTLLSQQLSDFEEQAHEFLTRLDELEKRWDSSSQAKLSELEDSIAQLQSKGIDIQRYNEAKRELSELSRIESDREQICHTLEDINEERHSLLVALAELSTQKVRTLKESATAINRKLKNLVIITVDESENIDLALDLIGDTISGRKDKIRRAFESDNFTLSGFINDLRKAYLENDDSGLIQRGITDAQRSSLITQAQYLIRRLEHITPRISLSILLNTAEVGSTSNFKKLTQLSKGQRATALLLILLADSDKPLVIDQPEDDLDNRFVYDGVVKQLRKLKGKRQIIASTHNANIPVLGDAELVLTLQASSNHADLDLDTVGSLDIVSVRKNIENILEGGAEAFSSRRRIYGF
jgi:PHP domain protein